MKYWEIIADNLPKAGWSLGWVSDLDLEGRTIWIVDEGEITFPDMAARTGVEPVYQP